MKSLVLFISIFGISSTAIAEEKYTAPTESDLATFTGSRPQSSSKNAPLIFVLGVDGKRVAPEVRDWDKPLAIAPGKHLIAIGIRDLYEEFEIDACAGCTYQALGSYEEKTKTFIKLMDIELWLVKQPDGIQVTDHKKPKPRPLDVHFNFHTN